VVMGVRGEIAGSTYTVKAGSWYEFGTY
jgi:hypothetical protein